MPETTPSTAAPVAALFAPTLPPIKSFAVTWLLSLLLGVFGADRFYLGRTATGVAKGLTLGGFGLWWIVDLVLVMSGRLVAPNGEALRGFQSERSLAIIGTSIFAAVGLVASAYFGMGAPSLVPKIPTAVAPPRPSVWVGGPANTDDLLAIPTQKDAPITDATVKRKSAKHGRNGG